MSFIVLATLSLSAACVYRNRDEGIVGIAIAGASGALYGVILSVFLMAGLGMLRDSYEQCLKTYSQDTCVEMMR